MTPPAVVFEEVSKFYGEVLGVNLVRERHIAAGDRCCQYRVADAPPA